MQYFLHYSELNARKSLLKLTLQLTNKTGNVISQSFIMMRLINCTVENSYVTPCFSSSLSLSGSAEAVVGRSDRKGSRETARLIFCVAGRSRHRGFGDAHWRPLWKSDAAGQLNQPPWRTDRHGPHMGQNAQLQRGGVRLTVHTLEIIRQIVL